MGKKNKSDFRSMMAELRDQKAKIEKKLKMIEVPCSHTKNGGKISGEFMGKGSHDFKCHRCGAEFNFDIIDRNELEDAIRVCYNAINQIKAFSDNPDKDAKVIENLGETAYNLREIPTLYKRVVGDDKGGKKKKHKKNHNTHSNSGYGGVSFINEKKKKF